MIKPRDMWAVVSPDGEIELLQHKRGDAVMDFVELNAGYLVASAGYKTAWNLTKKEGYRCVKVRVTAEEI